MAFTPLYNDRTFTVNLPYPSECNSSVDFDEGRAWMSGSVNPDGSDFDLRACYIEFGHYVRSRSAGVADMPKPGPDECLIAARSGSLQTIEDWDAVYEAKPIKAGMTLCFETEEGTVARAEVTEAKWKRYSDPSDPFHLPSYTFKTTAWAPVD
ncbi:hypothetical protein [Streptomyces sp. NPDC060035]|uniref:hypothetical protein n=1 Tax=Streptomyces sp. NPDC060035 TaxID=3347044 RepID=UPI0036A8BE6A